MEFYHRETPYTLTVINLKRVVILALNQSKSLENYETSGKMNLYG